MSVWKSASLISPSKMIFWEVISSIRHSVPSPDETPRSSSKIVRCASYFQLSSQLVFHLVMKHCVWCLTYRAFSITWPASMQIYGNKRNHLHKKRVQLPQDWLEHQHGRRFIACFGTPIWPPWSHVKTLYCIIPRITFTCYSKGI